MDPVKLSSIELYRYNLKLNFPLIIKGTKSPTREGLILHIKSSDGKEGFGEIAPLSGFSQEPFEETIRQIQSFKHFLLSESIPDHLEKLDEGFEDWLMRFNLFPSVRFGCEMAILNYLANQKHTTLAKLLSDTSQEKIRLSGLLQGPKNEVLVELRKLLDQGYKSFKLKVGLNLRDDIEKTQAVIKMINGQALLHLDVNQGWSLNHAIQFVEEAGLALIEYVEEPFQDINMIEEFVMRTTVPVALDESLTGMNFNEIKSIDGVDLLILKPTIIGSIEKTVKYIKEGRRLAISPVVSSLFESSLGILTLANLAGLTAHINYAGLDTVKWFKEDLLIEPLKFDHGRMDISKRTIQTKDINFKLLTRIS